MLLLSQNEECRCSTTAHHSKFPPSFQLLSSLDLTYKTGMYQVAALLSVAQCARQFGKELGETARWGSDVCSAACAHDFVSPREISSVCHGYL